MTFMQSKIDPFQVKRVSSLHYQSFNQISLVVGVPAGFMTNEFVPLLQSTPSHRRMPSDSFLADRSHKNMQHDHHSPFHLFLFDCVILIVYGLFRALGARRGLFR